jgi:hypothetical protein
MRENDDEEDEGKINLDAIPLTESTETIQRATSLEMIERRIELERERSNSTHDEIFRKLKVNASGYERLKTTLSLEKPKIFGMNHPEHGHTVERHRGNPVFDILGGETVFCDPKAMVHCEHNFDFFALKGNFKRSLGDE